jgi:hypothetical protein
MVLLLALLLKTESGPFTCADVFSMKHFRHRNERFEHKNAQKTMLSRKNGLQNLYFKYAPEFKKIVLSLQPHRNTENTVSLEGISCQNGPKKTVMRKIIDQ